MNAPVDACHAIGQADVALGLAGLSEDNIFRKELRAAGVVMAELIDAGNAWCDLMPGLAGGPEFDRLVAALAQVPRKAPTTSMQFTLRQAETLLAFFGGANADMTVEYFPANHWPDNPTAPAGLYVYCTEYPDEGALWLGEENNDEAIEPTWQHIPPAAFGTSRVATPDGWKLAMFVLQSDMYHQLPQEERAVCDALVSENPYIAAAPQAGEQVRTLPDDLVLVPRQKIEFAATVLESDGDEYGLGAGLRILLAEAPAAALLQFVLDQVLAELHRATAKFPTWPTDPLHAIGVLGEEFGELTKAVMQATYEPHKNGPGAVREEALQTAAMALRFLLSLDRYEYAGSEQHHQVLA